MIVALVFVAFVAFAVAIVVFMLPGSIFEASANGIRKSFQSRIHISTYTSLYIKLIVLTDWMVD